MNQSFYTGALGAQQQQLRLNVQGNNIANVNTYGFKAEQARFSALLYQDLNGIDGAQLPVGTGTRLENTVTDFNQGGAVSTGRSLDYMIDGRGFFALVDPATNEISFTRCGAFTMAEYQRAGEEADENGQPILETVFCLSDGAGHFVLSQAGTLIEVTDPNEPQPVGIFDYGVYNGMEHTDSTRFIPVEKNGGLYMGEGVLHQGMLEASNVDLAEELTKVIESQRAYSLALKMVQTSDEIETTINGLRS